MTTEELKTKLQELVAQVDDQESLQAAYTLLSKAHRYNLLKGDMLSQNTGMVAPEKDERSNEDMNEVFNRLKYKC